MSSYEHTKGRLIKVLDCYNRPVKIQNYLEMEYSVYLEGEFENDVAFTILESLQLEEFGECPHYFFNDTLYIMREVVSVVIGDGSVKAEVNLDESISVEAYFYNGGGSWEDCVEESLIKLGEGEKND